MIRLDIWWQRRWFACWPHHWSVFLLEMVMGDSSVRAQRDNQSKSQCLYGWQVTSCDAGGKIQSCIHMGLHEVYLLMCCLLEQTWHDQTWCFVAPDQWACLICVTCLMITVHDPSDIRKTLVNPQTASVRSFCLVEVNPDPWHVPAEDDEGI